MPIYEYQCDGCGHQLEIMQSMRDNPLVDCPECQEARLRKRVSAAGFRLKGSGWYVTDFRDGGKKKVAPAAKGEQAEAAPSSSRGAAADRTADGSAASATAASPSSPTGGGDSAKD